MSVNVGYDQYLRKYRLLITSNQNVNVIKSIKTVNTVPAVPSLAGVETFVGKVKAGSLTVREGPSSKYKSLGKLKKRAKVEIYNLSGSYYRIKYDKGTDGTAYVSKKYVKVSRKLKIPTTQVEVAANAAQDAQTVETTEQTVEKRVLEIKDLRVTFNCEKAVSDTPNYSVISVYNMSVENIASIKPGDTVVLEAGYENGNFGMIFTGDIVQPYVTRESATDTVLNLVVQDGDQFLNSAFVMTTLSQACTQEDVINACVNAGNVSSGLISSALTGNGLPRGKVLFGKAAEYISAAARTSNTQFYIEDGKVNIVAASDYTENQAVDLNPRSGLIDMPGQTDDGVSAKCLINPSIKLNTMVHIDSRLVAQKQVAEGETEIKAVNTDGIYKIVKLTYKGDTHGEDWYCEFEALTQAGLTPSAMNADVTNPWR